MADDRADPIDDHNVNRAYTNAWIVYINGQEVPVSSVNVVYGVWRIPQAEIVMVPDPSLQRLGSNDRVTVQVFYCDYWLSPNKPEFRLLFDGEIIGWSYVSVQRGRSISFTAIDYVQIFTQLFFFFMSSVDDLGTGAAAQQIGVDATGVRIPGYGVLFPYSLFAEGLYPKDNAEGKAELIKRPIDYVYNLVRGLMENIPYRSAPAANFFAPWAQRTKFDRRFIALPYIEEGDNDGVFPILRSVQADWAIAAVQKMTANIGSSGSIWQVFEQVLSTLMMELAMIPTPVAVQSDLNLNLHGLAKDKHTGVHPIHLGNYFVKPQFLFGVPPACNVFYPSQITSFAYQENYATQPTRMYFNEESWSTFIAGLSQGQNSEALDALVRNALSVAYPEEVNKAMLDSIRDPANNGLNGKNMLVYPEEFFRGPVVDKRPMPRWFLFLSESQNAAQTLSEEDRRDAAIQQVIDSEILPGDEQRNLYKKYAAYEFAKEKYSRRNGGLTMPFNPYPVPGFPCAVFDHRSTQLDIFGYVMQVQHTLSSDMMSTDVSLSYGRTMREAFSLLENHIAVENTIIKQEQTTVAQRIQDKDADPNTGRELFTERIGPIAIGPAEPLQEIRDVTQNFVYAENFYRSLFYGFVDPAVDRLSIAEARTSVNRNKPSENNINQGGGRVSEVDPDELGARLLADRASYNANLIEEALALNESSGSLRSPTQAELDAAVQRVDISGVVADPTVVDASTVVSDTTAYDIWKAVGGRKKTAAFHYHDIIDFMSDTGRREGFYLVGMSSKTRKTLVAAIDKLRTGTGTMGDVVTLEQALDVKGILGGSSLTAPSPDFLQQLDLAEERIRNNLTDTNITGDYAEIVPKKTGQAAALFRSYDAAMRYNARPICSLNNYLAFLGADAAPSGYHGVSASLLHSEERVFPAPYYRYIRKYRAGPPPPLPTKDYSNTDVITLPDGVRVYAFTEADREGFDTPVTVPTQSLTDPLQSLPEDQPISSPAPEGTEPISTPAEIEQQTASFSAEESAKEQGVIPDKNHYTIHGVDPNTFEQTAADWDKVLRLYRHTVLDKKPPHR